MAITTEEGILASYLPAQFFMKCASIVTTTGTPYAWGLIGNGIPNAFVPATPGLSGATIDGTTNTLGGTLAFSNPVSGNSYLAKLSVASGSNVSAVSFFDFLWYNTGITVTTTTAQTVNSVTLPARDNNGSTNGVGVSAWLYVSSQTTASTANCTISYTNPAGTSGQTGSLSISLPSSAVVGTFIPFTLAGNDTGVKSIESITLGTSLTAGTVNLIMIRNLVYIPNVIIGGGCTLDWADTHFPRLYDGTAISMFLQTNSGTVTNISGDINIAQG